MRESSTLIFPHIYPVILAPSTEKRILSPLNHLGECDDKNQLTIYMLVYFLTL